MRRGGCAIAVVIAQFVGCSPTREGAADAGAIEPASSTIGAGGGTIASSDGRLVLEVPPGALSADVVFTVAAAHDPPAGAVGAAYAVGPEGTTFAVPARLRLAYDAAAGSAQLAHAERGTWIAQPGSVAAAAEHVVTALTSHVSPWAVVTAATAPCTCHAAELEACCHGCFVFDGTTCSCDDSGDPETFLGCYAARVGAERVPSFCSRCLLACCRANGGRADAACGCESASLDDASRILSCSEACVGADADEASVCNSPALPAPEKPVFFECQGALDHAPPLPPTGVLLHVSCAPTPARGNLQPSLQPLSFDVRAVCTSVIGGACAAWQASWTLDIGNLCSGAEWEIESLARATGCALDSRPISGRGSATVAFTFACPNDTQADAILAVHAGVPFPP